MNLKQEADQFLEERYGMSDFNSYQRSASGTAIYPEQHRITYPALDTWREDIASEIGDVLWYCAALASDLNLTLGMIAGQNLAKLEERKDKGTLGGSGDTR